MASQDQAPPGKGDILVGGEGVQELTVFVELADALVVGHRDRGPGSVGPGAWDGGFGVRGAIANRDILLSLVADFEPKGGAGHAVFQAAEFDHVLPLG